MLYKHLRALSVIALLSLTLAGTILLLSCKNTEVQSQWSTEPVKVDGEMTEWPSGSTVYFEDSGVQLGLRNDNQNLYILFRLNNEAGTRSIRRGGLTLWLDNSGKKRKNFGIRYAGGPSFPEMQRGEMSNRGGFWDSLTPEQKQRITDMQTALANQIVVINKKSNQEIAIPADGSSGPKVNFGSPQGAYTYEFTIPLQKSDVSHYGIGAQPGQTISLGLEWGGSSENDRKRMREEMGGGPSGEEGMPPGGGGGMPPGGGPPGRGRGGFGMQSPEKQEIWVKTQLALGSAR